VPFAEGVTKVSPKVSLLAAERFPARPYVFKKPSERALAAGLVNLCGRSWLCIGRLSKAESKRLNQYCRKRRGDQPPCVKC
jgi:hypothetical protein